MRARECVLCVFGAAYTVWGLTAGPEFTLGRRIDARKISRGNFRELYEGKVPVVLTNVLDEDVVERWGDLMSDLLSDETIEYDARVNASGDIENYECTFGEFLEALGENSDHSDSMYLMNEDILNSPQAAPLHFELDRELLGEDWFAHFPPSIRPKTALIVGGAGARSFLHADPYEWVGWNILFEGCKVWTFFPPDVPMEAFGGRRNAPEAWGDAGIAAGWVVEGVDLYREIGLSPGPKGSPPTALNQHLIAAHQELDKKDKKDKDKKDSKKTSSTPPRPLCFHAGAAQPLVEAALAPAEVMRRCVQIVQREGELVVIPPAWWHQVYHVTPSIAVAGQYFNEDGKQRVFGHMLRWSASQASPPPPAPPSSASASASASDSPLNKNEDKEQDKEKDKERGEEWVSAVLQGLVGKTPQAQVQAVLAASLEARLGVRAGKEALEKIVKDQGLGQGQGQVQEQEQEQEQE